MPILQQVLYEIARDFEGDHVEVGTQYGESAIILAKGRKNGLIYCIDPMEDLWPNSGYKGSEIGNAEKFWARTAAEGVQDKIVLIQKHSIPWPLEGHTFSTALIDGLHIHPMPMWEWDILNGCVENAIVIDDVSMDGLQGCIARARSNPNWSLEMIGDVLIAWRIK